MSNTKGGCVCGSVRYEIEGEAAITAICHCKHCQKQAGTAFSIVMGVPRDNLQITEGKLKTYEDSSESGEYLYRKFCPTCGSPIMTDSGLIPDLLFIKAGTLDDASSLKPDIQIWGAHQISLGQLQIDAPKVDGNPPAE